MRKIALLFVMAISLVACKTSNSGTMTSKPKETNIANKAIKGEWTLQSITYSQSGKFNVTLLNDTSKECFEGSTWKFVPNNNRGHYTINASDCSTGQRNYVSESNQGIRLHLANLSDDSMVWEQTLRVDGKPFVISMNFVK